MPRAVVADSHLRRTVMASVACGVARSRADQIRERLDLGLERAPAREQTAAQVAVHEEAHEGARLARVASQALAPPEREEAGGEEDNEPRNQGPAAAEPPRRPRLRAPAERIEERAAE